MTTIQSQIIDILTILRSRFFHSLAINSTSMRSALIISSLWLVLSTNLNAKPGTGKPLVLNRGEVRQVSSVQELKATLELANRAKIATTILIED